MSITKGKDEQPAHLQCLLNAFVIHYLNSILALHAMCEKLRELTGQKPESYLSPITINEFIIRII